MFTICWKQPIMQSLHENIDLKLHKSHFNFPAQIFHSYMRFFSYNSDLLIGCGCCGSQPVLYLRSLLSQYERSQSIKKLLCWCCSRDRLTPEFTECLPRRWTEECGWILRLPKRSLPSYTRLSIEINAGFTNESESLAVNRSSCLPPEWPKMTSVMFSLSINIAMKTKTGWNDVL